MKKLFIISFCFIALNGICQKSVYIPLYLQDAQDVNGSQFSWDKTAESDNFILIWGATVGTDPTNYPDPELAFNPAHILDTLESILQQFRDLGFVDESAGTNLGLYKIPVVLYGTWGPQGAQGFANGGSADGVIGAFWVHPIAMHTGQVAAHELTHSLQAQTQIDYRTTHGLGPVWLNAGIFWETHGNFMRNLLYPEAVTAWGMDVYHVETWGDWKNTYENYELLMAIMASDGIAIINRLWRESLSQEYPLQAYKRLSGFNQDELNDRLFQYARRMATFDFPYNNLGSYFRQYRNNDLRYGLPSMQATWTILAQNLVSPTHYRVPTALSPEEFAYNIIPIYPDADSCAVLVKFKGHLDANSHAGWRYGFVASNADGTVARYGETFAEEEAEIGFSLLPGETKMYLVIMGAPKDNITTNTTNDTWHGYPKHFRFPYELSIEGGVPEGFQAPADFRPFLKPNGTLHPNGGGWVENSASVANSVYVGPHAMVFGISTLTGNVRLENTAMVRNANISGNVIVRDNALVSGGILSENAIIGGQAFVENDTIFGDALVHMRARVSNYKLHGNIEVGGDVIVYNDMGDCDNGVYYRLTNYYDNKLLECDGRTAAHPVNADVNNVVPPFAASEMNIQCQCDHYPDCLVSGTRVLEQNQKMLVFPNPTQSSCKILFPEMISTGTVRLYNSIGQLIVALQISNSRECELELSQFSNGIYTAIVEFDGGKTFFRVLKQ